MFCHHGYIKLSRKEAVYPIRMPSLAVEIIEAGIALDRHNLEHHLELCKEWFDTHVTSYRELAGDDVFMVERKVRHVARVLEHARAIIEEAGIDEELASIIEMATLLHDVGRFPQLVTKGTYDDRVGFNHAEEGVRLIQEASILSGLDDDAQKVILSAVNYHNCAVLPKTLGHEERLALEILRDADKLDAVRNNLKYLNPDAPHGKALKSGVIWDDIEASPSVLDMAIKRQLIPFKDIQWSNDFILFLCCWLYDLHFHYSYLKLKESGNYERLLDLLPDDGVMGDVKKQFREDLDWIISRSR